MYATNVAQFVAYICTVLCDLVTLAFASTAPCMCSANYVFAVAVVDMNQTGMFVTVSAATPKTITQLLDGD